MSRSSKIEATLARPQRTRRPHARTAIKHVTEIEELWENYEQEVAYLQLEKEFKEKYDFKTIVGLS